MCHESMDICAAIDVDNIAVSDEAIINNPVYKAFSAVAVGNMQKNHRFERQNHERLR